MGNQPTVRPARPDDGPEVARLAALMYEALGIDANDDRWTETVGEALVSRSGKDAIVFVADDPVTVGRLAGIGAGVIFARLPSPNNPQALVGYIQWVSTDPTHQRKGVAHRITQELLSWFEANDVSLIELHASPAGEAMYRSLGFKDPPNPALRRSSPHQGWPQ